MIYLVLYGVRLFTQALEMISKSVLLTAIANMIRSPVNSGLHGPKIMVAGRKPHPHHAFDCLS